MLEQRIEELTAEVKSLTASVKSLTEAMKGRPMIVTPAPYLNPTAPFTGDPEDKGNYNIPNEKPKSEDTTNTSQTSSPELPAATYEHVKRATNAVSKISREKAIAGLARFGVQSAMKLPETKWAEYVAYMGKVASGETDPEASHE